LNNGSILPQYSAPDRQKAVLQSVGIGSKKKLVGIAPFSRIEAKMYPLDKMEKVVEYYHGREDVQLIILGGGEKEKLKAEEWTSRYPEVTSLINKLSFDEEITVISACKTIVSMDSANMHLAAFAGVPVISIWGPALPRLGFYPANQKEENAIQKELDCRPCSFWGEKPCTNPDKYECMNIDPQIIIDKINSII
ncbi:MAG: glycosyltransferase family 9 protein, partial [Prevotella sp.]|nr:glycosyltransferase family 9 protein [Prevotella sp.]